MVVAAEAVGRFFRVEGVRHAQQLLHACDAVVAAAIRVGLGLQEIGTVRPIDAVERALFCLATANLKGQQAVSIGVCRMRLHIHGIATGTPLQDAHAHTHLRVGDQRIAGISHYRLVAELLRCLRHRNRNGQHHDHHCEKFLHCFDI